jgi:hypothetical protein
MVQGQYRSYWTANREKDKKKEISRLRWMDDTERDFSIVGAKM